MAESDDARTGRSLSYEQYLNSPEGQSLAHATCLITRIALLRGHLADYVTLLHGLRTKHDQEVREMQSRVAKLRHDAQSTVLTEEDGARFAADIKSLEDLLEQIKLAASQVRLVSSEDPEES